MNRRTFIKTTVALAISSQVPDVVIRLSKPYFKVSKGNAWVHPNEIAVEALNHLEDAMRYISYSAKKGSKAGFCLRNTISETINTFDEGDNNGLFCREYFKETKVPQVRSGQGVHLTEDEV